MWPPDYYPPWLSWESEIFLGRFLASILAQVWRNITKNTKNVDYIPTYLGEAVIYFHQTLSGRLGMQHINREIDFKKACSKQINHKMSKHFSILSKLWCNSNKQSKCVTDAISLLLEYGKISKLYNIQMRNEGLCTKTGALNHISYCLTRGFK